MREALAELGIGMAEEFGPSVFSWLSVGMIKYPARRRGIGLFFDSQIRGNLVGSTGVINCISVSIVGSFPCML